MRFLVEVDHDASGRVTGSVAADGRAPVAFDGWLDLVRLLEGRSTFSGTRWDHDHNGEQ